MTQSALPVLLVCLFSVACGDSRSPLAPGVVEAPPAPGFERGPDQAAPSSGPIYAPRPPDEMPPAPPQPIPQRGDGEPKVPERTDGEPLPPPSGSGCPHGEYPVLTPTGWSCGPIPPSNGCPSGTIPVLGSGGTVSCIPKPD
jgi:hypothetical protein